MKARTLLIHRVLDDPRSAPGYASRGLVVRTTLLESIAAQLSDLQRIDGRSHLYGDDVDAPQSSFRLTFDDGFIEHSGEVLQILERYHLKATFFVATAFHRDAAGPRPLDYLYTLQGLVHLQDQLCDQLRVSLHARRGGRIQGPRSGLAGLAGELRRWTWDDVGDALVLLARDHGVRLAAAQVCAATYMSQAEWVGLAEKGHAVAAHSHTHRVLAHLSAAELAADIGKSLCVVQELIPGSYCDSFAYPFGGPDSFDERAIEQLQRRGVTAAFVSGEGSVGDQFRVGREPVSDDWKSLYVNR